MPQHDLAQISQLTAAVHSQSCHTCTWALWCCSSARKEASASPGPDLRGPPKPAKSSTRLPESADRSQSPSRGSCRQPHIAHMRMELFRVARCCNAVTLGSPGVKACVWVRMQSDWDAVSWHQQLAAQACSRAAPAGRAPCGARSSADVRTASQELQPPRMQLPCALWPCDVSLASLCF